MDDAFWTAGVRAAGACHFLTVALAAVTPIPANWEDNLARLPEVHRRFAVAQNIFIGATMLFAGGVSVLFAPQLVAGTVLARVICAAIALWWAARLVVLPWLRVGPELRTPLLRTGFVLLHAQCAIFMVAYGWLALRG
ncbi:MAG: hypothetical protein V4773_05970 [Verrucomicrobiota bacterium]